MKKFKLLVIMSFVAFLTVSFTACERKGSMEKAGEQVDHATHTLKNNMQDTDSAQKLGKKMDDATNK
ncbi:MAG: hypothetical protein AAGA27_06885 [Pseudomonadota bacterium]